MFTFLPATAPALSPCKAAIQPVLAPKPSGIVAADFNHDGNLDVATVNAGKNNVTVLTGSATGALTLKSTATTGTNPIAISVIDVDSDGNSDVVTFDSPTGTTGEVDVLLGNGDGTLQAAQASSQAFKPGTVAAVATSIVTASPTSP